MCYLALQHDVWGCARRGVDLLWMVSAGTNWAGVSALGELFDACHFHS
jgi:hypothetical protein